MLSLVALKPTVPDFDFNTEWTKGPWHSSRFPMMSMHLPRSSQGLLGEHSVLSSGSNSHHLG